MPGANGKLPDEPAEKIESRKVKSKKDGLTIKRLVFIFVRAFIAGLVGYVTEQAFDGTLTSDFFHRTDFLFGGLGLASIVMASTISDEMLKGLPQMASSKVVNSLILAIFKAPLMTIMNQMVMNTLGNMRANNIVTFGFAGKVRGILPYQTIRNIVELFVNLAFAPWSKYSLVKIVASSIIAALAMLIDIPIETTFFNKPLKNIPQQCLRTSVCSVPVTAVLIIEIN